MNIYDLAKTLKKAEENENTLRTIMTITNSTTENVIDNVTLLFENAEPTNKVKIEGLIEELQGKLSDISSDYECSYDDVQGARDSIDSMPSELDSLYEVNSVVEELQELIDSTDDDEDDDEDDDKDVGDVTLPDNATLSPQQP